MLRRVVLFALLLAYGLFFLQQERFSLSAQPRLEFPLPAAVEKAVLGYLRQLGGEIHFIKTGVFVGALSDRGQGLSSIDSIAANLDSAAELNPPFIDTYYYCESFVASQGLLHVRRANMILKKGMAALPENWTLPFFIGFNEFYHLDEPVKAAETLRVAAMKPKAPSVIGHLASVLAAKGGDIQTGLTWLKAMYDGEKNEKVKRGYKDDIADYETALKVQRATQAFRSKFGREAMVLDELVPEFLDRLPAFRGNFVLKWDPPVLRLQRPQKAPAYKKE